MNALTYKEIFPLIKANRLWLGATGYMTDMVFGVPEGTEVKQHDREKAAKMGYVGNYTRLGNTCWYTNLDHKRRHDNIVCVEKYDPAKYPKFDNYDAINVDKISNIPKDYDGVMGVPISFLDKYNTEQFEIVGMLNAGNNPGYDFEKPVLNSRVIFTRLLIRRKAAGEMI